MDIYSPMVHLGPKEWSSSLENHSRGPKTPTYFSNPQNGVNILNHLTMTPLRGNVWLVEEIFLSLNGHNIPLGPNVQASSLNHLQGPKSPRYGDMVAWISMKYHA